MKPRVVAIWFGYVLGLAMVFATVYVNERRNMYYTSVELWKIPHFTYNYVYFHYRN